MPRLPTPCPPDRHADFAPLEARLHYRFRDKTLLAAALTHSSWANENGCGQHNERLEFLGDAVLEVHISHGLYERFPAEREGGMTSLRSRLVSEGKLAELARDLELGQYLNLGKGEEAQGGRERAALLADALEAVLGAVYLDGGHDETARLVARLYENQWPDSSSARKGKDYKTRLQEVTQARFRALPAYVPLASSGPEHAKLFEVRLELPDGRSFLASGGSLKRAEQEAARKALEYYGTQAGR
ncbi:MAG: ribonuclease III [Desulfovibrionaceae bacterium]|nr:ribonuclease III [Desulfovibrionaceae bacterium]